MDYRTVLVSLEPGRINASLIGASVALARRFDAVLVGRAACRPIHCICHDYPLPVGLFEEDRRQMERHLREAEIEFRTVTGAFDHPVDWSAQSCLEPLADYLANEAASADILVVGTPEGKNPCDATRQPDLCNLVMNAGRPVLLLPFSRERTSFDRILVAWKDTREARRAIADALPLLGKASQVVVVGMDCSEDHTMANNSAARIVAWLSRHGVKAEAEIVPTTKANSSQLIEIARRGDADLIVAGAHGYSHQGIWSLGGITAQLLSCGRCALLSH